MGKLKDLLVKAGEGDKEAQKRVDELGPHIHDHCEHDVDYFQNCVPCDTEILIERVKKFPSVELAIQDLLNDGYSNDGDEKYLRDIADKIARERAIKRGNKDTVDTEGNVRTSECDMCGSKAPLIKGLCKICQKAF